MIKLKLPLPPSINNYYQHHCKFKNHATMYISKAGKEFRKQVEQIVIEQRANQWANIPLRLEVRIFYKTKHRNDLDNRIKPLQDALTHANVWEDDALIDELFVTRGGIDKDNPRVEIEITAL